MDCQCLQKKPKNKEQGTISCKEHGFVSQNLLEVEQHHKSPNAVNSVTFHIAFSIRLH